MGLEMILSSTRHSRKDVSHSAQVSPQRVWVIVLAADWHVLQQVPVLLLVFITFPVSVRMFAPN